MNRGSQADVETGESSHSDPKPGEHSKLMKPFERTHYPYS
jgi:hypothetical protein